MLKKKYLNLYLLIILCIIFMISLFIFGQFFLKYQYVAEWLATFSLIGVFMQLQWHHQDIHEERLKEKRLHKISIKVVLNQGHINGIISNLSNRPLAYVQNYSGKYVHDLVVDIMFPNMYRKTPKGFISVTPDNMSSSKIVKPYHTYISVPMWIYNCKYMIKDTRGDKKSITSVLTNGQLFKIFNDNFFKHPGIYKFNLFFSCYREQYSYKYNALIVYKYSNNIKNCHILKLSASK